MGSPSPQQQPSRRALRNRAGVLCKRAIASKLGQKISIPARRAFYRVLRLAMKTSVGAKLVAAAVPATRPVLCAACFTDRGLKFDAARIGIDHPLPCPNCGAGEAKKLTPSLTRVLAVQFFVRGSVHRSTYGAAPIVQCNELRYRRGDFEGPRWLRRDIELISEQARIGLFHYGPHLWMLGEVQPLIALQDPQRRNAVIDRILGEYPERRFAKGEPIYRLRLNPEKPIDPGEYDSPPDQFLGRGRLDGSDLPVLYCSQDIEGCVHECRVTVEDNLFLATLMSTRDLRLLDVTALLQEEAVTEFDSLDIAIHMLFFAADHSYEISRAIARAAKDAGFDGLLYPSYFSQVRSGAMPFETVYGLSVRKFPIAARYVKSGIFANVGLFGRPVADGRIEVTCVNRLVLHKVRYDIQFGPAV